MGQGTRRMPCQEKEAPGLPVLCDLGGMERKGCGCSHPLTRWGMRGSGLVTEGSGLYSAPSCPSQDCLQGDARPPAHPKWQQVRGRVILSKHTLSRVGAE